MLINEEMTNKILNACMEVHNELGNGFLEPVYQEALEEEFKLQGIVYEREKLLPIMYKGKKLTKDYFADFLCYQEIIVEIKSVSTLSKPHKAQVLNYLNAANLRIGLLVNFGETSLKWQRISNL
ncbi:MAG: GxxExxY protein [Candidatus Riflebacteria bacterium]|nr:GxxExxY protein [Candidatus Riflebacteria bacterium]